MRVLLIICFFLSSIALFAIVPPNPDDCLDCDNVPWITGTISYNYSYNDPVNGPTNCLITVGYGYRYCNGEVDCYIDRLFIPSGGCATKARNTPGFYENAENELTIQLATNLGDPIPNGSQKFNHWRPASCGYLCFVDDWENQQVIGILKSCFTETSCCVETITAYANQNGNVYTNVQFEYETCLLGDQPFPDFECLMTTPCWVKCE